MTKTTDIVREAKKVLDKYVFHENSRTSYKNPERCRSRQTPWGDNSVDMSSLVPRHANDGSSQQGRDELIALLYRQHSHGLSRYLAARFGRIGIDPEDVIHSAFLKLADHPDLHAIADFRAFIFTLACNIAIDNQRRSQRRTVLQDDLTIVLNSNPQLGVSSEKILIDRERLHDIEAALRRMPKLRRRIFLLVRIEGLSVQDVAAQFAMTEAAVYKHVARALSDCALSLQKSERKAGY